LYLLVAREESFKQVIKKQKSQKQKAYLPKKFNQRQLFMATVK
jgi:hypothetical protein